MSALSLHHAIFTTEKDPDLPLCSAAHFLRPAPERDGNPTGRLFSSVAYQDLIQRQPTHPDGPVSGWDLGLDLLGDPITAAERKSLKDYRTKMKLRRLHAINIALELLFGVCGVYSTVRYFLALADGSVGAKYACALVLGIMSALVVALVTVSILMPLFPQRSHLCARVYTRCFLRICYLFLLSAGAVLNLVLVLVWHPSQLCDWDIDISWYTSGTNTVSSPCRTSPFAAWIAGAILRLVVTLTVALSFVYTLRSYHGTRHPTSEGDGPRYSPHSPSEPEDVTPVTPSPLYFSNWTLRLTRSEDSNRTLDQSNITLPKSGSISTIAPSTSCTVHSRSHSTPPPGDGPHPRISPPTSRRASARTTSHGSSVTQAGLETPSWSPSVSDVTAPSYEPQMLRRTSRISVNRVAPDTTLADIPPHSEMLDGPTMTHDAPEIRSYDWKPGHRGGSIRLDVGKTSMEWENTHVRHVSEGSAGAESYSTQDDGESVEESDKDDAALMYSYGYGASGPIYPYLDTYNPEEPNGYAETSSLCEDEEGLLRGRWEAIPGAPVLCDISSEPRSLPCREEEGGEGGGEEEEYVAMMGGFVRRMATIESLGSKEAAGTHSTTTTMTTDSVAHHSMRSGAPASQFSSVRFTDAGSACTSSSGARLSRDGSHSTAYLSFSSGGTGMRVNERGELLPGADATGSLYDRRYYTASGNMDDGDR